MWVEDNPSFVAHSVQTAHEDRALMERHPLLNKLDGAKRFAFERLVPPSPWAFLTFLSSLSTLSIHPLYPFRWSELLPTPWYVHTLWESLNVRSMHYRYREKLENMITDELKAEIRKINMRKNVKSIREDVESHYPLKIGGRRDELMVQTTDDYDKIYFFWLMLCYTAPPSPFHFVQWYDCVCIGEIATWSGERACGYRHWWIRSSRVQWDDEDQRGSWLQRRW